MTQEQAFKKWCPQMPRDPGASSIDPGQCCIGSLCMWWRWSVEPVRQESPCVPDGVRVSITDGFCGKAGKP